MLNEMKQKARQVCWERKNKSQRRYKRHPEEGNIFIKAPVMFRRDHCEGEKIHFDGNSWLILSFKNLQTNRTNKPPEFQGNEET